MGTDVTELWAHPSLPVGPVDPRIFGGFLEHMGRAVYEGVYEPASPHADGSGCRTDVLGRLSQLDLSVVRYPGGNFASGYHWLDGVGPQAARPTVRDAAWRSVEPNTFGTDEFLGLAGRMGWTPMLTANLGTGTPEEAADWVEYCNAPTGTRWADLRAEHGRTDPWNVPLWCLGNEMDGSWQLGHVPADEYGRRAQQAAMQMKAVDPSIETVVCGTSDPSQDSYGRWDRTALEAVGGLADYLSVHRYVGNHSGDVDDYLAVGVSVDRFVEDATSVCRHVAAVTGRRRPVRLCVDEWNVWYRGTELDGRWTTAPHLIEEQYDLSDALVVAQFLNSFVRHADVVAVANLAQVVNVIAPLLTRGDDLLVQSTFHAFRMASTRLRGTSLRVGQTGPTVQSRSYGTAPLVDASVVLTSSGLQTVLVNRSTTSTAPVTLTLPGATFGPDLDAEVLTGTDAGASNTWEHPDVVAPAPFDGARVVHDDTLTLELPPFAVVAVGASFA